MRVFRLVFLVLVMLGAFSIGITLRLVSGLLSLVMGLSIASDMATYRHNRRAAQR
jgi:hypothetical protein